MPHNTRFPRRRFQSAVRTVGLALFALMLAACSQSSVAPAVVSIPTITHDVAILNFSVPPEYASVPTKVEGWWFGAQTVYRNVNAGSMLADSVAAQMDKIPSVNLYSRDKITTYLLGKRQLLMQSFPGLLDADYTDMLNKISPLDYGRELGVDQVVNGRILRSETRRHNTIETWRSEVEVEVELWDMKTGQMVWSRIFREKKRFASQPDIMLMVAKEVAKQLDKHFYGLEDKALGTRRPTRPEIESSIR